MPDLTKNILGDTGLNVTRLSFGAMEIRGPRAAAMSLPNKQKQSSTPSSTQASTTSTRRSITARAKSSSGASSRTGATSTSLPPSVVVRSERRLTLGPVPRRTNSLVKT